MRALIALLAFARIAAAAPSSGEAKVAFDRGVAAYSKGDFAGAAAALEQSYKAEPDPDTLFAWAQSERKANRCDKAVPLYERLLKFELPDENKQAVRKNLEECKALLPAPKTAAPPVTAQVETPRVEPKRDVEPPPRSESRPWYRDPVGDTLVVIGAGGVGVGIAFLVSARSADSEAKQAANYFTFRSLEDTASSRSKIGIAASASGAVLMTAGIVWYATHRGSERRMTAWADGHGGGIAIAGGF